jgi:hypothetical protein
MYGSDNVTKSDREDSPSYFSFLVFSLQRFTQYLASSNSTFQLSNFLDKSGVQGVLKIILYSMNFKNAVFVDCYVTVRSMGEEFV